jgi:uncharacterized surface protein with fasciclin (FAS1) repeats
MRDTTASGSFRALAESIALGGLAKTRRGHGSLTVFAPSDPALAQFHDIVREVQDALFPEAATVIAAH